PTRRYVISPGQRAMAEELDGKVPIGATSLRDFLVWGMQRYPARNTMVIIKKHGLGFAKSEPMAPLSARDLDAALAGAQEATGRKVAVVSFDSCAMQQMEVAYQIKEHADVMTASEENVFAIAFPYAAFLRRLREHAGELQPRDVGGLLVDTYRRVVPHPIETAA